MKLFPKRKERHTETRSTVISKSIGAGYKRLQAGWATWMMKRTEKFSRRTWLALLLLFVLSAGSYNVYVAVTGFTEKGDHAFSVTPIKRLKHVTETGETNGEATAVSEAEYQRIKKFRGFMDSLARSPSGKALYDSITRYRPGLMDSVILVENYYEQLKQK